MVLVGARPEIPEIPAVATKIVRTDAVRTSQEQDEKSEAENP